MNRNQYSRSLALSVMVVALISALPSCSKSSRKSGAGELETGAATTGALTAEDLALHNQQRFGSGNIPTAEAEGVFRDVHFEYNSSIITPEGREIVRENAQKLQGDSSLKVQVEGHCDKRGTSEYNMALGEERAKAVAGLLTTLGAKPSQINIVSYGEEVPLDSTESEDAFAKNRRAHLAPLGRTGNAQFGGGENDESRMY